MHWTAYQLVRMVNGLFVCWKEAAKQSGNEASQFFFKLLVSLAGAPTNTSTDRFQYLIRAGVHGGLACATTLPVCFSKSLSACLGHRLFVWQVCTAFIPFGLLVNYSTSFQTVQPASKLFSLVYKQDHFGLYNRKRANPFKNWMTSL